MIFTAQVKVMPLKELLDPQGKAVMSGLKNLGLTGVEDVRVGKNISLKINAGRIILPGFHVAHSNKVGIENIHECFYPEGLISSKAQLQCVPKIVVTIV